MNINFKKQKIIILAVLIVLIIALLLAYITMQKKEIKIIKYERKVELLSPTQNTTWQNDYEYTLDEENSIITLNKYIGTATELTVPGTAVIDGQEYTVALRNSTIYTNGIWYEKRGTITSLVFEEGIQLPKDCSHMFYDCNNLTSLDISSFDTSNVTDMGYMFYNCSSLTSLNVSSFNTTKVTSMFRMFNRCSSLTSLDLSDFDTSKITTMEEMFLNCSSLTSLNVSNFNTSNVTSMLRMFCGCSSLTSLNLTSFNTSNVTEMGSMFSGCSNLTSLNLSNFNTSSVTGMVQMFEGCNNLASLDISNFNTSNVTSMLRMFRGCSSLTNLNVTSFNTSNVTDMGEMFLNCSSLTSLNVSSFDTNRVTDMSYMFYYCNSLTNLNLSNFKTSSVTNMTEMFYACSNLTNLDIRDFDTSNVTNMSKMFCACNSLANLDVSNFNTSEVTNMTNMFEWCSKITNLDLSSFDMNSITEANHMFLRCDEIIFIEAPINIPEEIDISLDGNYYMLNEEIVYENTTINKLPKELTESTSLAKLTNRVTGVELDKNQISLDVKDMDESLLAIVTPEDATDPRVSWISSNEQVVRVEDGRIIPVKGGTAEITAKTYDGGYTASANITVTETLEVIINSNIEEKEEGENAYLEGIEPKTQIGEIEEKILQTNGTIKVYKGETQITNTKQKIGTGMKIQITLNNEEKEYIVIVTGDCTGDGDADIRDMVKINNYRLYGTTTNFGTIYQKAADINKDGSIDIKDMVRINNYRLYGTKL